MLCTFRCVLHCIALTCRTEILQATSAVYALFLLRPLRCTAGIANLKNVSAVSVRPFNHQFLCDNHKAAKRGRMNSDILEFELFCR